MEVIFELLSQFPWVLIILLGLLSSVFRKNPEEQKQKQRQQQRQQQQRQQTAGRAQKRQDDYEDYRRESASASYEPQPKREEKPRFDWDVDVFGEGKLEELEQKLREKVNPYLEKIEQKKEQVTTIKEPVVDEIKELSIQAQDISKDSPILRQELQLSEGRVVNASLKMNKRRVVEGVMWAEILGQPRARNPHHPIYTEFSPKRK